MNLAQRHSMVGATKGVDFMRIVHLGWLLALCAASTQAVSDAPDRAYPRNVYWGDPPVHTSYSTSDANLSGFNEMPPSVAYRFARGEAVQTPKGVARLARPLDFLVIADHASSIGVAYSLQTEDEALLGTRVGKKLNAMFQDLKTRANDYANRRAFSGEISQYFAELPRSYREATWAEVVKNAEDYNEPGRFSAFAGYEWTSLGSVAGVFGNLHRVVIYRDGPEHSLQVIPYSAIDSRNPEDLWEYMANYEADTGGQILAIPHNPNVSNGEMFALTNFDGEGLTAQYAEMRRRFEPLLEVTQIKGDSEVHPWLSPDDEFADFETWHSWAGRTENPQGHTCCPEWDRTKREALKKSEYARSALKNGLSLGAELGVNPFKFGMIGATDAHTSFGTADEDNYWGKFTTSNPSPTRMMDRFVGVWESPLNWETAAGGYAGVWATENSREAIFAAMERKEVYATTGPRMTVRFFGGWEFVAADAHRSNLAEIGYERGVPMGGDLPAMTADAPTFLVWVQKDPNGANLDRVQIVKGWRDKNGRLHEKVFNAAVSDGREIVDNAVEPLISTVEVDAATYSNHIGAAELAVMWADEAFDPMQRAFYYVRAIEIPTPRWTAYDAKAFALKNLPAAVPLETQERIYSSPIWYTPNE